MNESVINEVMQGMLPYLNNGQLAELQRVLSQSLHGRTVIEERTDTEEQDGNNQKLTELFVAAKRVEGCSEKSLTYYSNTIGTMLKMINKDIRA